MRACLDQCEAQRARIEATVAAVCAGAGLSLSQRAKAEAAGYFAEQARIQIDQIERRVFRGEDIPHAEKVFSIFEPHTRWMTQGKAGVPQELGVPVCIVEDQHQFILHHEILRAGGDTDCAVPAIARAQARFPALAACGFDQGFHSPAHQDLLGAMPRKGGLSQAAAAHEGQDWFRADRQRHAGVESAISHLEHCGLARVRDRSRRGFARAVALSALAASCKRLGRALRDQERQRLARQQRLRAAWHLDFQFG